MNTSKPDKKHLSFDLLAGLTFDLVNIPQSMAHALLAAVNPVFGLYTLMLATPVGALFTSATFMNISTTSALAVATGDTLVTYKQVGDIADVPRTLPVLTLPDLSLIGVLILPAISIEIIGLVQGASVSQAFPNPDGNFSNASRDFLGQRTANLATSFFRGIKAGGSSSGTALVVSAGARTRWLNIFAGLFVAIVVLLFANLVELVAMPPLAGLVIVAGIQMININVIRTVWQTNTGGCSIMVVTFGSTLIMPLQYAVLLGVAISILLFVFQQSNILRIVEWDIQDTGWSVERPAPKQLESARVTVLHMYGNLFYAAADTLEKGLPTTGDSQRSVVILLLRGYEDNGSTVISVLRRYTQSLQANAGKLILAGVSPALHAQLQCKGSST